MKFKKIIAAFMAASVMLSIAACSSSDEEGGAPEVISSGAQATEANLGGNSDSGSNQGEAAQDTYVFSFNGTSATVNDAADAKIEGFGSDFKYTETPSCAFQGMDKVYTYNSFLVRTYPKDDVDYILSIEFKDDTITTPEGIYIGSSEDDVRSKYGEPTVEGTGGISYTKGNCELAFVLKDGKVAGISYNRVSE